MNLKPLALMLPLTAIFLAPLAAVAQDASPHHTAMHADHWINHHVSAPHAKKKVKHIKHDKSTHHAAVHAEHWIDHHVSAPHKN